MWLFQVWEVAQRTSCKGEVDGILCVVWVFTMYSCCNTGNSQEQKSTWQSNYYKTIQTTWYIQTLQQCIDYALVGRVCVELPAGLVDAQEAVEETAVRELKEETGYEVYIAVIVIWFISGNRAGFQHWTCHLPRVEFFKHKNCCSWGLKGIFFVVTNNR